MPRLNQSGLSFRVFTETVEVFVAHDLFDVDGHPAVGLADGGYGVIYLRADMPPRLRLHTLLHELWHCWRFKMDRPATTEGECDHFGVVAQAAFEDLERQGGTAAIDRLFGGESFVTFPGHLRLGVAHV
jgi:hypothetical protein